LPEIRIDKDVTPSIGTQIRVSHGLAEVTPTPQLTLGLSQSAMSVVSRAKTAGRTVPKFFV
jgi:hypothetical protein